MDNRKNTILLTVIAVATLLVAVVGATFAYFTAQGGDDVSKNINVTTETAAVQSVYDEYRMSLECGVLDPETALPEMNEKMYAAGLQNIIDEKQAQLDEWLESKGE